MRRAKLRDRYPEKSRLASVLQAASKRRSRQIGAAFVPVLVGRIAAHHAARIAAHHAARIAAATPSARPSAAGVPREASFAAHDK